MLYSACEAASLLPASPPLQLLSLIFRVTTREVAIERAPIEWNLYCAGDHTKIAVKIPDEGAMLQAAATAQALQLPVHIVTDLGRTQIAANSQTVLAIFGPRSLLEQVTRDFKLY